MSDSPSYELTLILLSPPLGWLGLHHFYLGNRKKGSLYILLFLTGIPVILATFDTIIILKKGKEKFIEKHGSEEELDEYYVQELMKRRPELIMASPEERREYVSEIREEKDIEDATNSKDNSENDESHEETESGDDDEEDSIYSEYYGDWE
jgi:TM2 domain-containing membrane protein YozV